MTNHCTYTQALALKELGFDMPVKDYYLNDELFYGYPFNSKNWNEFMKNTSAPTRTEVLQWAREKKKVFGVVMPVDDWNSWGFNILAKDAMSPFFDMYDTARDGMEYPTHAEAESALVDKIIEILKTDKTEGK